MMLCYKHANLNLRTKQLINPLSGPILFVKPTNLSPPVTLGIILGHNGPGSLHMTYTVLT